MAAGDHGDHGACANEGGDEARPDETGHPPPAQPSRSTPQMSHGPSPSWSARYPGSIASMNAHSAPSGPGMPWERRPWAPTAAGPSDIAHQGLGDASRGQE